MTFCKYFLPLFLISIASRSDAQALLPEAPQSSALSHALVASGEPLFFALNPSQSRADSLHELSAAIAYSPFVGGLKDATQSSVEGTYYSSAIGTSFTIGLTN